MHTLSNEKVIFSIDNPHDIHQTMRFSRQLSNLIAVSKVRYAISCVGYYQGELEPSWCVIRQDFNKYIKGMEYLREQESFLHIPGSPKEKCWLSSHDSKLVKTLSPMSFQINPPEEDSWTYFLKDKFYGVCYED